MEGGLPVLSRLVRSFTNIFGDATGVDPERRNAVLLIAGIGVVVLLALGLIVYGYYTDRVEPRRENVLRVGDRHFNYAYIERRIKSEVARGLFDTSDFQTSVTRTVAGIQREELIRLIARERGIVATDEDIDAELRSELGLGDDVSHDEMAAILRREILRVNLPLGEYLEIIEAEVLQTKIEAQFTDTLPGEAEQVNLNLIAGGTQTNAILAKRALDAGTPFVEVAQTYSQDNSARAGGAYGWAPKELLEPEVAEFAFNNTGRSGIIETKSDFFIVEVLDKQVREVTPAVKNRIGDREFRKLLEEAFTNSIFAYRMTPEQLQRLANAVAGVTGPGG
jgi:hypothetical protein